MPGFLARKDLPPVELPLQHALPEAAVPKEETASLCLSLEVEIDQFHFKEDKEEQAEPILYLLDSEDELNRHSTTHYPKLVISRVDSDSVEEDEMPLDNKKKGLRNILKGKGASPRTPQDLSFLLCVPLPLLLPTTGLGLLPIPNLKKKKKEQELEEG